MCTMLVYCILIPCMHLKLQNIDKWAHSNTGRWLGVQNHHLSSYRKNKSTNKQKKRALM